MNKKNLEDTQVSDEIASIEQMIEDGWQALHQGQIAAGQSLAQQAFGKATRLEAQGIRVKAQSLVVLAEASREQGQYTEAITNIRDAQVLYEDLEPDVWLVRGLYILANAYDHLGDLAEAVRIHHVQLNIAREINDVTHQATALRRIGAIHAMRGQDDRAMEYYHQCLEIYEKSESVTGLAGVYNNMSEIFQKRGDFQNALEYGQRSLALHEQLNLIAPRTFSHASLARTYHALGNQEKLQYHLEQSLHFARESKRNYPQIFALQTTGILCQKDKDEDRASRVFNEALVLAHDASDPYEQAKCLRLLAEFHAAFGRYEQAYTYHVQYHERLSSLWQQNTQTRFETLETIFRTKQAQTDAVLQRQLRHRDQRYYKKLTDMKDEVMSDLSHDLKNPLTNINVVLHMLKRHGTTNDEKGEKMLNRIQDAAKRMETLITNLLDLARFESAQALDVTNTDIIILTRSTYDAFQVLAEKKNIVMAYKTTITNMLIDLDPQGIDQVLTNLLSNAIKYTPSGGKVTLNIIRQDDKILVSVQDTGVGIPEADIDKVFERFYRIHDEAHEEIEGTGLGLAICKSIVEQHNGQIWAESTSGTGTTFYFSLPITQVQEDVPPST